MESADGMTAMKSGGLAKVVLAKRTEKKAIEEGWGEHARVGGRKSGLVGYMTITLTR